MTNWQSILQKFSGIIVNEPVHIAPSAIFKNSNVDDSNKICPLTNLSFLSIKGTEAEKFLQGQLTCDIREITEQTTRLSGHCNPKGRLHGIFHVIQLETNHYCLALPESQLNHILSTLKKYAIFSKVKLDILPMYSFGLIADHAHIKQINNKLINLNNFDKYDIPENEFSYIKIPSHDQNIHRFLVLLNTKENEAEKIEHYWQNLNRIGFQFADTTAWNTLNILALLPTIYPQTTEKCLPHYLNLPQLQAVNFKKGCYTGQEIVARMEYLGNIKKTLKHNEFDWDDVTPPPLGEGLPSDMVDHILLDYVPIKSNNSHTRFLGLFMGDLPNPSKI